MSKAFFTPKDNEPYFQGAINGGSSKVFCAAIKQLQNDIDNDTKKNITAIWHDESHWNKYLSSRLDETKILLPSFAYPEGMVLPYGPIILMRDKKKYGGHFFLRNIQMTSRDKLIIFLSYIKNYLRNIIRKNMVDRAFVQYLSGGLGNQMFQYAKGKSQSIKKNQKLILDLEYLIFPEKIDTSRRFGLDVFNIQAVVFKPSKKNYLKRFYQKGIQKAVHHLPTLPE